MLPTITVGMAHWNDPRAIETLQACIEFHDVKRFVVVNASPDSHYGKQLADYCQKATYGDVQIKHVPLPDNPGTTQTRQRIFEEAETDGVVVMDCHVIPGKGSIDAIREHWRQHPDCLDLISGPLTNEACQVLATHFDDKWGDDGMWGVWGNDPRGSDPHGEPFEIPGMGLGMFACRREAWLGFNPHFRGFGGEEMYIHRKFRQAGRRVLCLPGMRWWHDFNKLDQPGYANDWRDRTRNYVLGHLETGDKLDPVKAAFVGTGKLTMQHWDEITSNPVARPWERQVVPMPPPQPKPAKPAEPNLPPAGADLDAIYEWTRNKVRDLDQHLPKLKELASQCEHVTEFTNRRESTVGLAAGRPKTLISYQRERDPLNKMLHEAMLKQKAVETFTTHEGAESLSVEPIAATDLLFIDSPPHTAERLWAELERHGSQVRRYLVLHDTALYPWVGEGEPDAEGRKPAGLLPAINRWTTERPEWFVAYHTSEEYGLTVLSCQAADRPAEPVHLWNPGYGPGSELSDMLATLDINPGPSCDCKAKAAQMNIWGVKGCKLHRDEIVKGIVDNAPQWGWYDKIKAAALAVTTGLAFKLDVTDPYGSLVDEAIRRAEVKEASV